MAFFAVFPSRPLELLSATDLAREHERLDAEVAGLRDAVSSHALVDQAIGVVIALSQLPAEECWRVLRDVSQHTNVKLRHVAEHILAFAQGGTMPDDVRAELDRAIGRYAALRGCDATPEL
ncbi:ANTAR domain-containing protein [Streptomyces sp. NPDC046716]|uniref:ANTAR domain-containing protein n=1 Tax=Streptomyces sp. NPDC046716 TaxID=3157093 RepID=UPI0033DCF66D